MPEYQAPKRELEGVVAVMHANLPKELAEKLEGRIEESELGNHRYTSDSEEFYITYQLLTASLSHLFNCLNNPLENLRNSESSLDKYYKKIEIFERLSKIYPTANEVKRASIRNRFPPRLLKDNDPPFEELIALCEGKVPQYEEEISTIKPPINEYIRTLADRIKELKEEIEKGTTYLIDVDEEKKQKLLRNMNTLIKTSQSENCHLFMMTYNLFSIEYKHSRTSFPEERQKDAEGLLASLEKPPSNSQS